MSYPWHSVKVSLIRRSQFACFSAVLVMGLVFSPANADSHADPKRVAVESVERNAAAIATIGDVLYYFGEPGMQEYESSKYLKQTLEDIGFKVELGGAGLPTNVWATWGSGKPVIAIATEMDALPEGSQTPAAFRASPWSMVRPVTWKGTT
jgi:aminobenzoyl-glutamate utilization protein B